MAHNNKILRNGNPTGGGGMIYKGSNYYRTEDGLKAVATNDPVILSGMGISDPGNSNMEAAFKGGLGAFGIYDGQVYSNPAGYGIIGKFDARPNMKNIYNGAMDAQMKALSTTTGGLRAPGSTMVPIYFDPRIVDVTRKYTPLVEMIQRVGNMGKSADYNKITSKGSAAYMPEDPVFADQDDDYEPATAPIRCGYSVGRITGLSQVTMPGYTLDGFTPSGTGLGGSSGFGSVNAPSANQIEVLMKTRALRELQENTIVNGDGTANDYNGIINTMSTTNTVDLGTTALKLSDLKRAVRLACDDGGKPSLAVCSSSVYEDIENLMTDQIRESSKVKLPWGFETLSLRTMAGQIPLVFSMFMSNVSGSKAIYFLDMAYFEMRTTLDVTYEKLAKTGDSDRFMLKTYETLINRNPAFSSSVTGISA